MKLRHKLLGMGLGVAVLWGSPIVIRPAQILAQTENQQNIQALADQLLQQGIEQFYKSDFRGALTSWEKSLELYRQIGDRQGEAASLGAFGNAYDSLGEYQRAIAFHQQSLDINSFSN